MNMSRSTAITGREQNSDFTFVIPGRAPTGPAAGRPDDRLRGRARNPYPRSGVWIPGLRQAAHPGMTINLILVVACALVDADKRVLIAQRPEGKTLTGLWEFPGGKVEPGERPEATLTFASHAYDDFHLVMPLYICRRWHGEVIAREGQRLAWVRANKLRDYPMPAADIPLIPHLIDLLM